MPTPFSRPRVELDAVRRTWRDVPAVEVSIGDTVADFGIVEAISTPAPGLLTLINVGHGVARSYDEQCSVKAFVRVN